MNNNDTLRRLRYALNITDAQVAEIIAHTGRGPTPAQVGGWLKREDKDGEKLNRRHGPERCQYKAMPHRCPLSVVAEFLGYDLAHRDAEGAEAVLDAVDHRRRTAN